MALSYEELENAYNDALNKIKELETELYFCNRNNKLVDEIQKRK